MSNIVDITELLRLLREINNQEDEILIDFLAAIKEYSALLLSGKSITFKLTQSFGLTERINKLFQSTYFMFAYENQTESEIKIREILEKLNSCTDAYFDLMSDDLSEEELKERISFYEGKIAALTDEYRKAVQKDIREGIIEDFKKGSKK